MKKPGKMTPEELERQLENQRRLYEVLLRRQALDETLAAQREQLEKP